MGITKPQTSADWLAELNPAQAQAARSLDGPLLILAGAGTGKTKTLITRLACLLTSGRTYPSRVLAVTFTNKAANEMRLRVHRLIGERAESLPWLGTFHSICARILRRHAETVGLKSDFTILDQDDQKRLIKQILRDKNLDEKRHPPQLVLHHIGRWKDRGLTPDRTPQDDLAHPIKKTCANIWRDYQKKLKQLNAADFGDLINECLVVFAQDAQALQQWRDRFEFILVDEYQDTNIAQYLLLRLLSGERRNICCVGDDDQSIYGWRGAEVGNILRFEKDFPGAKIIRLEQNYRSTQSILSAASALIARNSQRLGKTLWTNKDSGPKTAVWQCWDGKDESHLIGDQIAQARLQGETLNEIAILVRASFQIREFEERLLDMLIPYRIVGGMRFYERAEIRDANAYLRLIMQHSDDLAFERIINLPRRGLGQVSLNALKSLAAAQSISLLKASALAFDTLTAAGMQKKAAKTFNAFAAQIARWRELADKKPPEDFARIVLEDSFYMEMWRNMREVDAQGRLDNLKEMLRAIAEFNAIADYLEHVALVMDMEQSQNEDRVNVMTLHAAKGLEFDYVFLPGWEEEIFPHRRSLEEGPNALEEERRLAYVGLTRAKKQALISFANSRLVFNEWKTPLPSRFIDEIGEDNITRHNRIAENTTPFEPAREYQNSSGHSSGARIIHEHFGQGTITAADGDKLTILFDEEGRKMIKASYVKKL